MRHANVNAEVPSFSWLCPSPYATYHATKMAASGTTWRAATRQPRRMRTPMKTPATSGIPTALLMIASSPHARPSASLVRVGRPVVVTSSCARPKKSEPVSELWNAKRMSR